MTVLAALLGLAAALLVPVHASAAATPARPADGQGNIGIQLLEAPVNRRDDPRAHLYIVDHVKPGTTIERRVKVSNDTGERRQFELYPASAEIKNGASRVAVATQLASSAARPSVTLTVPRAPEVEPPGVASGRVAVVGAVMASSAAVTAKVVVVLAVVSAAAGTAAAATRAVVAAAMPAILEMRIGAPCKRSVVPQRPLYITIRNRVLTRGTIRSAVER